MRWAASCGVTAVWAKTGVASAPDGDPPSRATERAGSRAAREVRDNETTEKDVEDLPSLCPLACEAEVAASIRSGSRTRHAPLRVNQRSQPDWRSATRRVCHAPGGRFPRSETKLRQHLNFTERSLIRPNRSVKRKMRIDLNSDLGESFGPWPMGQDEALMASITSANVACGFHAGDPRVMRRTVALARHARRRGRRAPGVSRSRRVRPTRDAGHAAGGRGPRPLSGGGAGRHRRRRRASGCSTSRRTARSTTWRAATAALADAIARAVAAFDRSLILFGLPDSELLQAGERAGLTVAAEVFADRAYEPDGSLASRRKPGSVIHDADAVVARAVRMVRDREVVATDGSVDSPPRRHDVSPRRHAGRGRARAAESRQASKRRAFESPR